MPNRFKQDDCMDMYHVRMTYTHARKARGFGLANFSFGVRLAIEYLDACLEAEDAGKQVPLPSVFLAKRRG